jgi:hypothetical protein
MRILSVVSGMIALILLAACANVQQIDRGRLAKRIMQLEPMPHQQVFITEMHETREGAAGGFGKSAGGGCGCN